LSKLHVKSTTKLRVVLKEALGYMETEDWCHLTGPFGFGNTALKSFFNAKTVYYLTQMSNVHKVIFIAKVCGHFQLWQVLSNGFQDFNRQFYTVVMLLTFILIIISILSQRQWHQLGHMQVCISLQTDNHASTPPLSFYRPDALPAAQPTASKHLWY